MKQTIVSALAASCAAFAACGATLLPTSDYQGTAWGAAKIWADGALPPNEAGAVIDTGTGSAEVRIDATNRIVGKITTTYGTMPSEGGYFQLSNLHTGHAIPVGDAPQSIRNTSFALQDTTLTFDNGGAGAEIRIDDGTLGSSDSDGTKRRPYRHLYDVPVVLADSLNLNLNFASVDAYGVYNVASWLGGIWGVVFSQKVSGAAGNDITINAKAPLLPVIFMDDANDFEGDINVTSGTLRAMDTCNLPREGSPFGRKNTIRATGGSARVDLGGFITGEGQTLELSGERVLDDGVPNGVLYSTWAREDAFAEWRGNVLLAGDTWIGGQMNGSGYPRNFYPSDTPGNFAITGPISDKDAAAAVSIVNGAGTVKRTVRFGGDNTFSGGLHLVSGYFNATSDKAFGTGGVFFDGGTYRFMKDDDASVFDADVQLGTTGIFNVKVDAGVTATANPSAFTAYTADQFHKYGPGTLVLTNMCHVYAVSYGGTTVFDLSQANYVKFGTGNNDWQCDQFHLYNDTRLVATGDESVPRTAAAYFFPHEGAGITFRAERNQTLSLMPESYSAFNGYATVETDGMPSSRVTFNQTPSSRAYPNNCDWLIYGTTSWATRTASSATLIPVPDAAYATAWADVTGTNLVDVTPALAAAAVPAGQTADCLRFNTPNDGAEIVLTLAGDLTLEGHTILVTPNVGATPIRITGGALKASSRIRVLNFNTNATVTIESDVAATSGKLEFVAGGPGKTVLKGAKSFNNYIYVIGGVLGGDCADAFGKGNAQWNSGYVFLSNGGCIEAEGDFNPVADATQGRSEFGLKVSVTGGGVGVAEGATLTLGSNCSISRDDTDVAPLKIGSGTLVFSGMNPVSLDVRAGTVQAANTSEEAGVVVGRDGATFVGARWAFPLQAGANGGGVRAELQCKRQFRAEGDCTVDLNGGTMNWNDQTEAYGRLGVTEFFDGTGTVHFVDRSEGRTGKISTSESGYRDGLFRGTFSAEVPVSGSGLMFPHATWCVPAGFETSLSQMSSPLHDIALARLTGAGTFSATATQSSEPAHFYLGEDGAAAADFPGTLNLLMGATICSAIQLVKVGDNAQRLSGAANRLEGNTIVRAGSLLVGADSPATSDAPGALGQAMVYVGDAETPTNAAPALLADGACAIANEIRVHATSPATARPTLGGTANAAGATFSGKVTLYRDVTFRADAGASVAFTGEFAANGHAVAKTGAGTVTLPGDVTVDRLADGTLETAGKMTFAQGATVDVSSWPLAAFDDRSQVYGFAKAAGGFDGAEQVTLVGLPESAAGWQLTLHGNTLRLTYPQGLRFLLR